MLTYTYKFSLHIHTHTNYWTCEYDRLAYGIIHELVNNKNYSEK